ncbi:hypothetical protein TNCT_84061 [Trichonephila clavata]|uniref:Uncharacterized protein n=1 Tax=Trichonephila clavata TaxID=2740835 RepID=A0A8X6G0F1_TRICU|nr:hypothetical protein TNCT_84061 [Trichonephila clavata]
MSLFSSLIRRREEEREKKINPQFNEVLRTYSAPKLRVLFFPSPRLTLAARSWHEPKPANWRLADHVDVAALVSPGKIGSVLSPLFADQ